MQNQEALVKDPKFLTPEYLSTLNLRGGSGSGREGDCCALQERRRWSGLDSKSFDVPATDSRVCGRFMVRFQDAIKDSAIRNRLIPPLMVKLVGSAGSDELERRRSWLAVDWAIREVAPAYFDMSPELSTHAAALRALPPITSSAAAEAAYAIRDAARVAAWDLRQKRLVEFKEKFRAELAKHDLKGKPAVEVAVAEVAVEVAAVVAVAVAAVEVAAVEVAAVEVAAVEVEVAVAAVVAVAEAAVEVAVAEAGVAAEAGSDRYWAIRGAVYDAVRKHFRENGISEQLRAVQHASWESGAKCLGRMLDLTEESAAA